ncbi:MAG TPA: hypothetical protein VIL36_21155 [Acidimicrobiales bacterium]
MNKYGRMMLDHCRRFRPDVLEEIADAATFFAEAGEETEAAIVLLRDEILAQEPQDPDPEQYRVRSYQALRTAEEVVLADHPLLAASEDEAEPEVDPEMAAYYRRLAEIDDAVEEADRILRSPTT